MTSQEQRRRSSSILPIYQRVQGSAKPLYYGGATGIRTREACPRKNNASDPLQLSQSVNEYRELQNMWIMVELRGFEPARHAHARTKTEKHFKYTKQSMTHRSTKSRRAEVR